MRYCILVLALMIMLGCNARQSGLTAPQIAEEHNGRAATASVLKTAQSYMKKNEAADRYRINTPFLIEDSTRPRETLIGFPLKNQDSMIVSKGWTEIGVVLGIPPAGDINSTHFPNELGYRYLVRIDQDGRVEVNKKKVRSHRDLETPNKPDAGDGK